VPTDRGARRTRKVPSALVLKGGTVLDESGSRQADVVVRQGRIEGVAPDLGVPRGAVVLDADGCLVTPGFVDLHCHLRQPGGESAETVETASRGAVLGGFTAVVAMPNTEPAIDQAAVVREVQELAAEALCEVAVAGAITVGRAGERLAPMAEMAALGVRIFTDDGRGVQDGGLLRRALDYARGLGVIVAEHCEDEGIADGGVMHEGSWSSRLGLPGRPAAAEEAMVARDLALLRATGGRLHLLHLSTAASFGLLAAAKAEGLAVTAEVTPHHLALTDATLAGFDPVYKVHPPLRAATDVAAARAACARGLVDALATDHAPHPPEAKEVPLDEAAPGMLGLQTAWPVALAALHAGQAPPVGLGGEPDPGSPRVPLARLVALLSWQPARIAGLHPEVGGQHGGRVQPGAPANLAVLDPRCRWRLVPEELASRSKNSPWLGAELTGRVRHTVVAGEPVVVDGEAQR
jgi:dihydroorotase